MSLTLKDAADLAAKVTRERDEARAESAALRAEVRRLRREAKRKDAVLADVADTLRACDPEGKRLVFNDRNLPEDRPVRELCERHGYGAVMDSAARQWRAKVGPYSGGGAGAFVAGPTVGMVQKHLADIAALARTPPKKPTKRKP